MGMGMGMATIGGVITTGAHPKALWPGIKTWWGRQYAEHEQEYPELVRHRDLGQGLRRGRRNLRLRRPSREGSGPGAQLRHRSSGLDHPLHPRRLRGRLHRHLRRTARQSLRSRFQAPRGHARVRRPADRGNHRRQRLQSGVQFVLPDWRRCGRSSRTTIRRLTGNQSNLLTHLGGPVRTGDRRPRRSRSCRRPTTAATRSASFRRCSASRRRNWFDANRIIHSVLQNDTANNAINVIKATGMFPKGIAVNHYFLSATAWFIRTNAPYGARFMWRDKPTVRHRQRVRHQERQGRSVHAVLLPVSRTGAAISARPARKHSPS